MDARIATSVQGTAAGTSGTGTEVDVLCSRLASLDTVRLPAHVLRAYSGVSNSEVRLQYLHTLLTQDPSVFLERHGSLLEEGELRYFDKFSSDYEVNFYLRALREDKHPPASKVKNRRYAQMKRLLGGTFFSEAAIKQREPLLYHELVGQYQPQQLPAKTGKLSEDLRNQHDELEAVTELQQRQQQQPSQPVEEVSEEEEDAAESETSEMDAYESLPQKHTPSVGESLQGTGQKHPKLSEQELQDNREELLSIMQARFLQGSEKSVDYLQIDQDKLGLDDDNAAEAERDAVERHFDILD